jgi:hypothetical protein
VYYYYYYYSYYYSSYYSYSYYYYYFTFKGVVVGQVHVCGFGQIGEYYW